MSADATASLTHNIQPTQPSPRKGSPGDIAHTTHAENLIERQHLENESLSQLAPCSSIAQRVIRRAPVVVRDGEPEAQEQEVRLTTGKAAPHAASGVFGGRISGSELLSRADTVFMNERDELSPMSAADCLSPLTICDDDGDSERARTHQRSDGTCPFMRPTPARISSQSPSRSRSKAPTMQHTRVHASDELLHFGNESSPWMGGPSFGASAPDKLSVRVPDVSPLRDSGGTSLRGKSAPCVDTTVPAPSESTAGASDTLLSESHSSAAEAGQTQLVSSLPQREWNLTR